jgi:hypothetical protein
MNWKEFGWETHQRHVTHNVVLMECPHYSGITQIKTIVCGKVSSVPHDLKPLSSVVMFLPVCNSLSPRLQRAIDLYHIIEN